MPTDGCPIGLESSSFQSGMCWDEDGYTSYTCAKSSWFLYHVRGNSFLIVNVKFPTVAINSSRPGVTYIEENLIFDRPGSIYSTFEFVPMKGTNNQVNGNYMIRKTQTNLYLTFEEFTDSKGIKYGTKIVYQEDKGYEFRIRISPVIVVPFYRLRLGVPQSIRNASNFPIWYYSDQNYFDIIGNKTISNTQVFDFAGIEKYQNGYYTAYLVKMTTWQDDTRKGEKYNKYPMYFTEDINKIVWSKTKDSMRANDTFFILGHSIDNAPFDPANPTIFFTLSYITGGREYISYSPFSGAIEMRLLNNIEDKTRVLRLYNSTGWKIK
jgi:hypothetical protein